MHDEEVKEMIQYVSRLDRVDWLMKKLKKYDLETYEHSINVAYNVVLMAPYIFQKQDLVLEAPLVNLIEGALLHDIGKLSIPKEILHKTDSLNKQDMAFIRQHPLNGVGYLQDVQYTETVKRIVLKHHEKLDGSGYPCGYCSKEIEDEVRAVTIADIFSAMMEKRCYKDPFSKQKALEAMALDVPAKLDARMYQALRFALGKDRVNESEYLNRTYRIKASNGQYFCGWNRFGVIMLNNKKSALEMNQFMANKELPKISNKIGMACNLE